MSVKKKWFTVVGLCDSARHGYHVRAANAKLAEEEARKEHDFGLAGCDFWVAGVFEGKLVSVDEDGSGLTAQRQELIEAQVDEHDNDIGEVEVEPAIENGDITKGLELKP